jgi:hypothetical protein
VHYLYKLKNKAAIKQRFRKMWETPSIAELQSALDDPSHPIGMRMRAAYYLRHVHDQADEDSTQDVVVQALSVGLLERRHGSLMRHEFAYVMGQLRDERVSEVNKTKNM